MINRSFTWATKLAHLILISVFSDSNILHIFTMNYDLTRMHGSKELACIVRHEVLKDYFISLWNTSTKRNKQTNLKKYTLKKGNQTPTNEQQYGESCLWLCYPTRSHLFWMLMQMHHISKKILKIHLLLDRSMYHIKMKDPLLYNPNIHFSTYVKNFSEKFSLQKKSNF